MVFLVILGLLKFVKISPIKPVLRSVGTGSPHCPFCRDVLLLVLELVSV